jgi:putative flippase GtrA
MSHLENWLREFKLAKFARYGLVGLTSNLALYVVYLALTWADMGHKLSISLIYAVGVIQTYFFNRNWTFRHDGKASASFMRYVVTYAVGYIFQLGMLYLFTDVIGLPHQLVVACLIFLTAVLIFVLQTCWVFPEAVAKKQ